MRGLALVALAACGDTVTIEQQLEATSGTRIKLERYLYEDGTRELDASAFYDTRLHVRCAPRVWADGELRCVPLTDDAVFTDAECSAVAGIVRTTPPERDPTLFIGYDVIDGERIPARLYRAGAITDHVPMYYERRDGACVGPVASPPEAVFLAIAAEVDGTTMPIIAETEVGAGRLALRVQTTTDGLFAPIGLRDRTLDMPCTATLRDDGMACEPMTGATAVLFAGANCADPVVVVAADEPVPPFARVTEPNGCAGYRTLGAEAGNVVWRRSLTGACERVTLGDDQRSYRLAGPVELAWFERTLADAPDTRRLQHVTLEDLTDPALRFTGDRLVDRATRGECRRELVGDTQRCMPATTVAATDAYVGASCGATMRVVELPARTCTPITFATAVSEDGLGVTLHAIGDPMTTPMYRMTPAGCQPYTGADGFVLHHLGPALPGETFPAAFRYGER